MSNACLSTYETSVVHDPTRTWLEPNDISHLKKLGVLRTVKEGGLQMFHAPLEVLYSDNYDFASNTKPESKACTSFPLLSLSLDLQTCVMKQMDLTSLYNLSQTSHSMRDESLRLRRQRMKTWVLIPRSFDFVTILSFLGFTEERARHLYLNDWFGEVTHLSILHIVWSTLQDNVRATKDTTTWQKEMHKAGLSEELQNTVSKIVKNEFSPVLPHSLNKIICNIFARRLDLLMNFLDASRERKSSLSITYDPLFPNLRKCKGCKKNANSFAIPNEPVHEINPLFRVGAPNDTPLSLYVSHNTYNTTRVLNSKLYCRSCKYKKILLEKRFKEPFNRLPRGNIGTCANMIMADRYVSLDQTSTEGYTKFGLARIALTSDTYMALHGRKIVTTDVAGVCNPPLVRCFEVPPMNMNNHNPEDWMVRMWEKSRPAMFKLARFLKLSPQNSPLTRERGLLFVEHGDAFEVLFFVHLDILAPVNAWQKENMTMLEQCISFVNRKGD